MKKFLFTFLVGTSIFPVTAQDNNLVVIGKVDSLHSKILNEQRKVLVYNPAQRTRFAGSQKYPVVYLLDGEGNFNSVVGIIEQLSTVNGNMVIPQMIVVGITNTNRMRDLSPSRTAPEAPFMDSMAASLTGGGEAFISFIEKELMPHMDSLYPTAPYRMLIGHSLGGLMSIHTLVNHPTLFNAYVAIDPSMWYDLQRLLKQSEKVLQTNSFAGRTLYLAVANTMEQGMDTIRVIKDTGIANVHIRSILALGKYLNSNKQNMLDVKWRYYNEEDHGSLPIIAEYDALRYFFKDYKLQLSLKQFMDPEFKMAEYLTEHFKKVSKLLGYSMLPPEDYVNQMGYEMLNQRQFDKAEGIFKMNTINYPTSSNTFDSLGDLYNFKGDKAKAVESYKKALTLQEVPETRKKLNELLSK